MPHNPSKAIVAAVAAMLLITSAAFADREVKRIDHPNGRSTYVVKPVKRGTTVGIYAQEQGLASDRVVEAERSTKRPTRINMGRGQYIHVRGNNR